MSKQSLSIAKKNLTPRQEIAFDYMVENGGTWSAALTAAGYSKAVINNPMKVTGSKAFRMCLSAAGMTPETITKMFVDLSVSSNLHTFNVPYAVGEKKTKGRKRSKWVYTRHTIEEIQAIFRDRAGFKISLIVNDDINHKHDVVCWVPDRVSRTRMVELTSKALNLLDDNKFEVLLTHVATPKEKEEVEGIFKDNTK